MNGSKKLIILLLVGLNFSAVHSQGFTFRWALGYSWQPGNNLDIPAPLINTQTPTVNQFVNMANSNDHTGGDTLIHNSYGHGFNVSMRIGYQINSYITVDMGVAYAISKIISCSQIHTLYLPDSTGAIEPSGGYLSANISTQSQSITLTPAITLSYSKPKFKFYPYLRAGFVLPVFGVINHYTSINMIGISPSQETFMAPYYLGAETYETLKTQTTFSIGFTGAVGVVYRVHSFLQFFAEVNTQILNLTAKKSIYTGWTEDGTDSLSSRGSSRNTINHVPVLPFSNIGFNIGVQLFLNHKIYTNKDMFEENRKPKVKKKPKPKEEEQPKQ